MLLLIKTSHELNNMWRNCNRLIHTILKELPIKTIIFLLPIPFKGNLNSNYTWTKGGNLAGFSLSKQTFIWIPVKGSLIGSSLLEVNHLRPSLGSFKNCFLVAAGQGTSNGSNVIGIAVGITVSVLVIIVLVILMVYMRWELTSSCIKYQYIVETMRSLLAVKKRYITPLATWFHDKTLNICEIFCQYIIKRNT